MVNIHYRILQMCNNKLCVFADGLDFFYATEGHARKMVDFLNAVLPCKYQHSKKLISHDIHSNVYNYKFTYSVEIIPVSKDSVVCLSKKLTQQLGGISSICLVHKVSNALHVIDPTSAQSWYLHLVFFIIAFISFLLQLLK